MSKFTTETDQEMWEAEDASAARRASTTETPETLRAMAETIESGRRYAGKERERAQELRARAAELEKGQPAQITVGSRVRVRNQYSPYRGKLGTVTRVGRHDIAARLDVTHFFDPGELESAGKGEAEPAAKSAAEEAFDKRAMKDQLGEALAALRCQAAVDDLPMRRGEDVLRAHGWDGEQDIERFIGDKRRAVLARATGGKS